MCRRLRLSRSSPCSGYSIARATPSGKCCSRRCQYRQVQLLALGEAEEAFQHLDPAALGRLVVLHQ